MEIRKSTPMTELETESGESVRVCVRFHPLNEKNHPQVILPA